MAAKLRPRAIYHDSCRLRSPVKRKPAAVSFSGVLDGGQRMFDYSSQHVGKSMAVVYIERMPEVKIVDGKEVRSTRTVEQVISVATIQITVPKWRTIEPIAPTTAARRSTVGIDGGTERTTAP